MDNIIHLRLEAHNDAEDRHRVYVVMVGRDLFRRWSLRICYGRAGHKLRELRYSFDDELEARRVLRHHLRRRLSAPRRIGCAYRLRSFEIGDSDAESGWLPAELVGRFLVPAVAPAA